MNTNRDEGHGVLNNTLEIESGTTKNESREESGNWRSKLFYFTYIICQFGLLVVMYVEWGFRTHQFIHSKYEQALGYNNDGSVRGLVFIDFSKYSNTSHNGCLTMNKTSFDYAYVPVNFTGDDSGGTSKNFFPTSGLYSGLVVFGLILSLLCTLFAFCCAISYLKKTYEHYLSIEWTLRGLKTRLKENRKWPQLKYIVYAILWNLGALFFAYPWILPLTAFELQGQCATIRPGLFLNYGGLKIVFFICFVVPLTFLSGFSEGGGGNSGGDCNWKKNNGEPRDYCCSKCCKHNAFCQCLGFLILLIFIIAGIIYLIFDILVGLVVFFAQPSWLIGISLLYIISFFGYFILI